MRQADRWLGLGNPTAEMLIKDYLRLVTAEQLQARVTPKQKTHFFVDKLTRLAEHLQRSLGDAKSIISFRYSFRRVSAVAELKGASLTPLSVVVGWNK